MYEIDTFFSLIKTFLFDEKTKVYVLQVLGLLKLQVTLIIYGVTQNLLYDNIYTQAFTGFFSDFWPYILNQTFHYDNKGY